MKNIEETTLMFVVVLLRSNLRAKTKNEQRNSSAKLVKTSKLVFSDL